MLDTTTERLITTTQVNFTDQSEIDEDGWICGNEGELLMWIPPVHRKNLHCPSNIWIAGKNEAHLDLSKFVHGCGCVMIRPTFLFSFYFTFFLMTCHVIIL